MFSHEYTFKTESKKYHALARVCNYIKIKKRRILMNTFIASQFSYCFLVWMSHSRPMHNIISVNGVIIYLSKMIKQISLLTKKNKSVSTHQINLQILATAIYKVRNDSGAEIMKDIFHFVQKPYNLRKKLQSVLCNRTHQFNSSSLPTKYEK